MLLALPFLRAESARDGDDSVRVIECVLHMSKAHHHRMSLTAALRSAEYISCTSTDSTSKSSNFRSSLKSAVGCLFKTLRRILLVPAEVDEGTTRPTMSTYVGLAMVWIHLGYVGPVLYCQWRADLAEQQTD